MNTDKKTAGILEDAKINVKTKLSALWAAVMFCYIYGDIVSFFAPGGYIAQSMAGKMGPFPVTQVLLLVGSVYMAIPCVMVFLSLILKPKTNRWANIILGVFYGVANGATFIAASWAYFIFFGIVETVLTALIVWHAFTWPKQEA